MNSLPSSPFLDSHLALISSLSTWQLLKHLLTALTPVSSPATLITLTFRFHVLHHHVFTDHLPKCKTAWLELLCSLHLMLLDVNYLFSCNFHDFIVYHNHSIMVAFSILHLSPLFFTHCNLLIVSHSPLFYDFLYKSLPNIYHNHPHHDLFLVPSHRAAVVN